jgi:hypothetical protein
MLGDRVCSAVSYDISIRVVERPLKREYDRIIYDS